MLRMFIVTAQQSNPEGADVRFGSLGDMAARLSLSALPPKADIRRPGSDVR